MLSVSHLAALIVARKAGEKDWKGNPLMAQQHNKPTSRVQYPQALITTVLSSHKTP
jgi:hypothetical protein